MTLDEFLEFSCRVVEGEALKLPSGGDLRPYLSYINGAGDLVAFEISIGMVNDQAKDLTIAFCRAKLREARAQMYVLVSAAWYILRETDRETIAELDRVARAEGTGGRLRDERRECILLSGGEPGRSVVRCLDIHRDYKGKIRRLEEKDVPTGTPSGRMVNLLDGDRDD